MLTTRSMLNSRAGKMDPVSLRKNGGRSLDKYLDLSISFREIPDKLNPNKGTRTRYHKVHSVILVVLEHCLLCLHSYHPNARQRPRIVTRAEEQTRRLHLTLERTFLVMRE